MLANKCPKCNKVTTNYLYEMFCNACKFVGVKSELVKVEIEVTL